MVDGAFLVVAHPGHELLLHDWMERLKPQVCVLTDGSGGQGPARLNETVRVVEATGASVGPVFGVAPDRSFYQAILRRDSPSSCAWSNASPWPFRPPGRGSW